MVITSLIEKNLLIYSFGHIEVTEKLNTEKLIEFLGNKLIESIHTKIKKETFNSSLFISILKNTSNTVSCLDIKLDCKIDGEIISIIDYKVYSYLFYCTE